MFPSFPSIQSFYQHEGPGLSLGAHQEANGTSDGFTGQEVQNVLHPLSRPWQPSRNYQKCPIASLKAGPHDYEIVGRVANFSTPAGKYQVQSITEGPYLIILSDDTGAVAVS